RTARDRSEFDRVRCAGWVVLFLPQSLSANSQARGRFEPTHRDSATLKDRAYIAHPASRIIDHSRWHNLPKRRRGARRPWFIRARWCETGLAMVESGGGVSG